ncbi:MAG: LPS export ABC transporter ATP-binding protein [Verrucomicrobia bacterium CG_4_10_14_3_um_filter_43_23]|nr:MAG: LPS export ABC transporter ATP-binding protein [Verrucomicrobia bacterium CG1_02_43_26]PIX58121.1 MAG: LPS export ABC transporter ATP-binding protein [Verrucomicrobia bacterium CG_4_10_14_3_um_filter_43_23]PIY61482.1 MAG: LPS export ABC transporter ATP-binding protein [Verrucomicrobia bacterium CG_4_10_14_0_8_um_filter_43_34]PJA44001.1 MAG: LPS export ABC transporter ATP-binding protein [Verrucomicrobia bacterium CG_4_9_14_3_um_filter_43_20]
MGLRSKNLVKKYGKKQVVSDISIGVEEGEIIGLLGPNGAGKTTSFYMIVGLVPVTSGEVFLDDNALTEKPMHKRARMGIGYLPQEPSVFRKLTVKQNLQAVAETLNVSKKEQKAVVEECLEELHLTSLADQKAYTLSGGERRRLEISRALVKKPKYLLMDEPFSGVDPINVADVQEIILKLKGKGIGILITDHNVRETLKIVDRAYLIHEGRVLCEGDSTFLVNDEKSRRFYLGDHFNL